MRDVEPQIGPARRSQAAVPVRSSSGSPVSSPETATSRVARRGSRRGSPASTARQRTNRRRSRARTNRTARSCSSAASKANSGPGSAESTSALPVESRVQLHHPDTLLRQASARDAPAAVGHCSSMGESIISLVGLIMRRYNPSIPEWPDGRAGPECCLFRAVPSRAMANCVVFRWQMSYVNTMTKWLTMLLTLAVTRS